MEPRAAPPMMSSSMGWNSTAILAAFQQKAAKDAAENHHNADNREHGPPCGRAVGLARGS